MKNIHILPTDKPSKLYTINSISKLDWSKSYLEQINGGTNQNIYITSDEEIKEGDWFYNPFINEIQINCNSDGCKKIIMTTDQDLIKDGIQAINNEFLEWFVKNPSCELVNIRKVANGVKNHKLTYEYKIIIPKEETEQKLYTEEEVKELLKRFAPHIRYNHKELPHTWSQVVQEWFAENKK